MKDEIAKLFSDFSISFPILIGVSGGADSMALVSILYEIFPHSIYTATVDHQLRPESRAEAELVQRQMTQWGIPHQILTWTHPSLSGNVEDLARQARYDLLIQYAKEKSIQTLCFGHHKDDQIETFLLALKRGGGVKGLAAMPRVYEKNGLTLLRPLLGFSKSQLRAYCMDKKIDFVDDPMNEDARFDRVNLRQNRGCLTQLGLTDDSLLRSISHLQRAQAALDFYVAQTVERMSVSSAVFLTTPLCEVPLDIALRVLSNVIQKIGQNLYPPSLEKLEKLLDLICLKKDFKMTLGGCILQGDSHQIKVQKE